MRKKALLILVALVLCFIWGNSLLPARFSNAISNRVTAIVGGEITHSAEQEKNSPTWLTSGHIRKLAHMTEFGALGAVCILITVSRGKKVREHLSTIALLGLSAAVIDETIQLFTGRTSAVKDIWIDSAGFAIGCVLSWVMAYLLVLRKRRG